MLAGNAGAINHGRPPSWEVRRGPHLPPLGARLGGLFGWRPWQWTLRTPDGTELACRLHPNELNSKALHDHTCGMVLALGMIGSGGCSRRRHAMRSRALVAAGLGVGLVATSALADEGYRHGRVRFVEPGVTLQRATEVSAEEAIANLPFLPGDRIWTDSAGRAEFQFPDGTWCGSTAAASSTTPVTRRGSEERIVLRLWSGSALVRVRTSGFARFEIETPAGMVQALDRGIVRVDVEAGETRVSVLRRRGGAGRRPPAGPARRGRAHVRALGRRGRGAAAVRPRRGRRVRPLGRPARVGGPMGRPLLRVSPRRARPLRGRVRGERARGSTRARPATCGFPASRSAGSPTRTANGPGPPTAGRGSPTSAGDGPPSTTGAGASRTPRAGTGCRAAPGARAG